MELIDGDRLAQVWPLKMTMLQWSGVPLTATIRADVPFSGASSSKSARCFPLSLYFSFTSALQPFPMCPLWRDTTWTAAQRHATAPASARLFDMQSHKSITCYVTLGLEARFQLTGACDRALMALTHICPWFLPLPLQGQYSPIAPAPLWPFTPLSSHVDPDLGGSGCSVTRPGRANDTRGEWLVAEQCGLLWQWHNADRGADGKSLTLGPAISGFRVWLCLCYRQKSTRLRCG